MQQQQPNPLEYGDQLLGSRHAMNRDPYMMQQAMAQQQQEQEGPTPEEQQQMLMDQMQAQLKEVETGNKIKEIALKLQEQLQKSAELEARIAETPGAAEILQALLEGQD